MANQNNILACCLFFVLFLLTLILCGASLSVLSFTEVGLAYSHWFKTLEDRGDVPYEHGLHFLGLGQGFKIYKTNLVTIEFSDDPEANLPMIKCRTKDGLELDIEASL